jgi:hypothetical protein
MAWAPTPGSAGGELYHASGTFTDWAFGVEGVLSFGLELRPLSVNPGFFLPPEQIAAAGEETLAGLLSLIASISISHHWHLLGAPPAGTAQRCVV